MIFGPESRRAKRYAQQDILNMSALKHIMLIASSCRCCKWSKKTFNNAQMKTLKNNCFSYKNWKNLAVIDGDGSWRWTKNSMQNEKVVKTSGESNNFEGRRVAKSKIIKNQWKYVVFLTATKRCVRQTIGNVMRAQRSKIEEISFNWKLFRFIWKMCHFWQTGAETVENVTFGERSLENKIGGAQQLLLGGHGFSCRFKAFWVRPSLSLGKKWGGRLTWTTTI